MCSIASYSLELAAKRNEGKVVCLGEEGEEEEEAIASYMVVSSLSLSLFSLSLSLCSCSVYGS